MKLVFANKFYFLKGGAERYLFDLRDLLVEQGHEVVPFAMSDGRNEPTEWNRWFVSSVNTEGLTVNWQGLRTVGRFLYSFEARRKFFGLLREYQPDLVHIHNIYHQISPSILSVAKRHGVPVVMTAHDYGSVAPNYGLFHDGQPCEHTRPHRYWAAVRHRCVRRSVLASAVCATELSLHRLLRLWEKVDRVIAPSSFTAAMLADYGVAEEKIVRIPHFIDLGDWSATEGGDYALFVGRLSPEKGAEVLIRAAAKSRVPVRIVGSGPEEGRLRRLADLIEARTVTFAGYQEGEDLRREYAGARFVVIPSLGYETFGLTALEAYAAGKPVIASQLGGLGEVVREGETGRLVSAGSVAELSEAMTELWEDGQLSGEMGRAGRKLAETEYSPETHYRRLMNVYQELL